MTGAPARRAPFPRALLSGDVDAAARALLGAYLVRSGVPSRVGRIVEVEAYGGPEDLASHARFVRSTRRLAMAAAPGSAYVYLVYGMHTCLNVVAGPAGTAAAVLIRAVAPLDGIDRMRAAVEAARASRPSRGRDPAPSPARAGAPRRLASGPALVAAAFDVDRSVTGADLCHPTAPLRLEIGLDDAGSPERIPDERVVHTARIGVAYAGEPWASLPRRLALADEPAVSGPRG